MPRFKYVALDACGNKVTGVMEAASAGARSQRASSVATWRSSASRSGSASAQIEITKQKVKPADLMNFSRQLAAFLRAGIPILDALRSLIERSATRSSARVLVDIADALRVGQCRSRKRWRPTISSSLVTTSGSSGPRS